MAGYVKKRPILLAVLIVAVGLVALLVLNRDFRSTATIYAAIAHSEMTKPSDPTTRYIRAQIIGKSWGYAVDLTPALKKGSSKSEIIAEITKSKFKPVQEKNFSYRQPRMFPAGSEFYQKTVEAMPCTLRYIVVISFDSAGELQEAWGTEEEVGCL